MVMCVVRISSIVVSPDLATGHVEHAPSPDYNLFTSTVCEDRCTVIKQFEQEVALN